MSGRSFRFGPAARFAPAGALLVAAVLAAGPAAMAFEPQRTFPDTSDGIYVFVDQLSGGLTAAQRQFAASHYVGTQKQTSGLIDALRVYNPNFIMIQYRLGVRESGHTANYIHNDQWSNDWANINSHEDWFVHHWDTNPDPRVYQDYQGWLAEYCMDCSGEIEGNTTYGWKEYWADCVISDIDASHGDGVFADSTHPPYAVPTDQYASPLGSPPHTAYIPHLEAFYDYVYQQLDQANKYYIPNIGGLCTTLDTTSGYYEDVHGAMVEGYATKLSEYDWRLQQNRTLRLLRNDKIYIAQNNVEDHTEVEKRQWYLSNFLLHKHGKSFINLFSAADGQLYWWPEYDLDLGEQLSAAVPGDISVLQDGSGIYYRQYERGLALVNPTGQQRIFTLPGDWDWQRVDPWGGGAIGADGNCIRSGGLTLADAGPTVTLGSWSGLVLIHEDPPPPLPTPPPTPPAPPQPYLDWAYTYVGDGQYGITFTVRGNDAQELSFFVNATFEGADGAEIQQVLAFGNTPVNSDDIAALYDPIPEAGYDMDLDSYFLQPFPSNLIPPGIVEGPNSYHIEAGTGGASHYLDAGLAYIVTDGNLTYDVIISRQMQNWPCAGTLIVPPPGDATYDGLVDGADYTAWADHYGQTGTGWGGADFNGDDVVDGADYTLWADYYDTGAGQAPEPAALILLAAAAAALPRRRRRA